jgi:hypothetical protein
MQGFIQSQMVNTCLQQWAALVHIIHTQGIYQNSSKLKMYISKLPQSLPLVKTAIATIATNCISKTELKALQKQESRHLHEQHHKEVKES